MNKPTDGIVKQEPFDPKDIFASGKILKGILDENKNLCDKFDAEVGRERVENRRLKLEIKSLKASIRESCRGCSSEFCSIGKFCSLWPWSQFNPANRKGKNAKTE